MLQRPTEEHPQRQAGGGRGEKSKGFFFKKQTETFWESYGVVLWDLPLRHGHNLLFSYFTTRFTFCCCHLSRSSCGQFLSTESICTAQSERVASTDCFRCCYLISFTFLDFSESLLPTEDASGFISKVVAAVWRMSISLNCMSLVWKPFPLGACTSFPEKKAINYSGQSLSRLCMFH